MLDAAEVLAALDRLDRAGLGFRLDQTAMPGLPARVVVFDRQGNGWQELGGDAWGDYPADGLDGVGTVGGRPVRCVTPELQVRHHLGYPMEVTDRHDLGLLAERFGVAVPPGVPGGG